MKRADEAKWQAFVEANSDDDYGKTVVEYAEDWANLMEAKLAEGCQFEEAAESTWHEAKGHEELTGFMHGAAVATLALTWVHGDDLRRWYNLMIGAGDEGERANESDRVLNPALATISTRENQT